MDEGYFMYNKSKNKESKMQTFKEIVEKVKDVISKDINGIVLDRHVAEVLGVSPSVLATNKSRDVIMWESLMIWCSKNKIVMNTLIFDQTPESLIEATNQLYMNRYGLST